MKIGQMESEISWKRKNRFRGGGEREKEREIRVNIEITRIKGRRVTGLPFKSKLFMAVGFDVDGERV